MNGNRVSLGLGLLSIGRQWGVNAVQPPADDASVKLIDAAIDAGMRVFDTAPAYARSEEIFGRVLRAHPARAAQLFIATKAGEHWDDAAATTSVDHGFDALVRSIDTSLQRLGRIDLLQIHKASAAVVTSSAVLRALDHAQAAGITAFGASVSDLEGARAVCGSGRYSHIQFPFNRQHDALLPVFDMAAAHGITVMVNRPFAMGALSALPVEQFRFILQQISGAGIILTGTSSRAHLAENLAAFCAASR